MKKEASLLLILIDAVALSNSYKSAIPEIARTREKCFPLSAKQNHFDNSAPFRFFKILNTQNYAL
jgi:hypothetical protein